MNFRRARLLLLGLLFLQAFGAWQPAAAQQAARPAQRTVPAPANADAYAAASRWTLGLLTSGIDGTALQMAADLARVLNDGANLRVIPMVGELSLIHI